MKYLIAIVAALVFFFLVVSEARALL